MKKPHVKKELLEKLIATGATYDDLCRQTGYSRSYIIRMLKIYGLKTEYAQKCRSGKGCKVCGNLDIPYYTNRRLCFEHLKETVNFEGRRDRRDRKERLVD